MHFMEIIAGLNDHVIWGIPMVALMIGTGIFLLFLTKGVVFARFPTVMRYTLKTLFQKPDTPEAGSITPFQAVCTALAATVGTGNIVGVAVSLATGGPGAVFWLWVSALVGMVIKYCEVTLSVAYRETAENGDIVGGPMYYIARGMGRKRLAAAFAIFGTLASFGIGATVQANALASGVNDSFGIPFQAIGIAAAFFGGLVLIGGIRRIANVTEILVPFMACFYIIGALAVCAINIREIPKAFGLIFANAFTGTAATGGFLGSTAMYAIRIGMSRGVFTHEAGMGSAPIAHASASTDHPVRQGLWGAFEVFFDAIVMCTITALVILTSGLWCAGPMMDQGTMSSMAFENAFLGGQYVVSIGLVLFAFATIVAWYYYGEKCVQYLFPGSRITIRIYQALYVIAIYIGCIASLDAVWEFADLANGLMAVPNLIALIALSPVIQALSGDFWSDPDRIREKDASFRHLLKIRM